MSSFYDVFKAFLLYKTKLKKNEYLSRDEIYKLQQNKLRVLVEYAKENSPFYRELYKDIDPRNFSLKDLPPITKKMMMENFDEFVTDRRIRLKEVKKYLQNPKEPLFMEKYHVMATGGSSGIKGILVYNKEEWRIALAGVIRWMKFMEVPTLKIPRFKVASIGGDNPTHGSYRLTRSFDVGLSKKINLNANDSIDALINKLNKFKPDLLSGYSSVLNLLANAQIESKLRIDPRIVVTTSEACTEQMKVNIEKAWGKKPFIWYGMTEVMTLACDCPYHQGLHIFEDLAIIEVVDEKNQQVLSGIQGKKILLTNFYNFTQPIIRYEIDDIVTLANKKCKCERNFLMIKSVEGRQDDILMMEGKDGNIIPFHALNFWTMMDTIKEIKAFKIVLDDEYLNVYLIGDSWSRKRIYDEVVSRLNKKFKELGINPPTIKVHFVEEIERSQSSSKLKVVEDKRSNKK